MKFNSLEIKEASLAPGNPEGFLFHKLPSRTFDSALKEKWFKLKGNLLFYYRLNEEGAVKKNEPNGVFILENFKVEKETTDAKYPYGFSLTWKDDLYRKHCFYARTDSMLQNWMTKIIQASYEMLRAKLLVLRLKIRNKSGKDPLAHLGLPLPVHLIRGVLASPSKASPIYRSASSSGLSGEVDDTKLSVWQNSSNIARSAPSSPLNLKTQQPLPPPRRNRDKKNNDILRVCEGCQNLSRSKESFKCHLHKPIQDAIETLPCKTSSFKSHIGGSSESESLSKSNVVTNGVTMLKTKESFKSHVTDTLAEDHKQVSKIDK